MADGFLCAPSGRRISHSVWPLPLGRAFEEERLKRDNIQMRGMLAEDSSAKELEDWSKGVNAEFTLQTEPQEPMLAFRHSSASQDYNAYG